jgi:hypothetical protein
MQGEPPSEAEIARRYVQSVTADWEEPHSLQPYEGQIKEWLQGKYSFQVIHRLLSQQGVALSESTVRRWIHCHFPQIPSAVILRATIAGEVMEVDFGYMGAYWEPEGASSARCGSSPGGFVIPAGSIARSPSTKAMIAPPVRSLRCSSSSFRC